MDFHFHILGSSSSGNCALIVTPQARVLIDAGFSGRRIDSALRLVGVAPESVDAVFFTHEHHDHSCGLAALSRRPEVRFFANEATSAKLRGIGAADSRWTRFENGRDFLFKDLRIHPFCVPHDAADPVAFRIVAHEDTLFETRLAWVTDLGHVTETVRRQVAEVDLLVLESNYDGELLESSDRPPALKQRIKGRHGHLSNEDAALFLESLENPRLRQVFLGHLSKECNRVSLVRNALAEASRRHPGRRHIIVDPASDLPVSMQ